MGRRLKGFIYCLLRDGKYYAYYTYNTAKGTKQTFSSKFCTPYLTDRVYGDRLIGKYRDDITKSNYHPNNSRVYKLASAAFKQIQQPGDRFVVFRVNSKKCPFNVHFLPFAMRGKTGSNIPISPKR